MRRRSGSIVLIAAILFAGAAGCARERSASEAPADSAPAASASAASAPAAPAMAAAGTAPSSAESPSTPSSATAPSPPLESGHAPFLSTLPSGGASPHGEPGHPSGAIALEWDAPAGWIAEQPRNPMRRAQYRLPGVAGAGDGECAAFYFGPGQGGDAQGNIARWVTMLTTPDGAPVQGKVSEQKIGGRTVSRVEAVGTYHPIAMTFGGEPPPPQPGWMLLGAVVPGPDANWFFRCAGPEKTIGAERAGFDALIASVREAGH